jgi:chorismate mutase
MAIETDDDGNVIGNSNDSRLAMLDRINDANDALRQEELYDINDDGSTEQFVAQNPDGSREALVDETVVDEVADKEIQRMADETADPEPEQPKTWKVKVNGREVHLTEAQMIERVQKVEAADQYLAEAARLRQEQIQKSQVSQQDPVVESMVDDDLAIARAIQMGSEEEAVAALRSLRKASPSLTKDEIAQTIDERLTFNEAIAKFRADFSDLVSDPVLHRMVLDADKRLVAQGDPRSYSERYEAIGNDVRRMAQDIAKRFAPAQADPVQQKLARKAGVTSVPKASGQKTASTVEQEAEETPSSIIANIAKSRGGPQWMNGPSTRQ